MLSPCKTCPRPSELVHAAFGLGEMVDEMRSVGNELWNDVVKMQDYPSSSMPDRESVTVKSSKLLAASGLITETIDLSLIEADALSCGNKPDNCPRLTKIDEGFKLLMGQAVEIHQLAFGQDD